MSLTPTDFHRPASVDELVDLLDRRDGGGLILGGGTFVHGLDVRGLLDDVQALIDIRQLGLDAIELDAEGVRIGATATGAALAAAAAVRSEPWLGAVADALAHVPMQVRNSATVGGSVATACPLFDLPVALAALECRVAAQSRAETRWLDLLDFFTGMFQNALARGEFVSELHVPTPPPRTASAFEKIGTNANDLAIVSAAARVTLRDDGSRVCEDSCIVIGGGVAATPVRAASAERLLRGAALDGDTLRAAGAAAAGDADFLSDTHASAAYRTRVAGVLVRRALERALTRLT